MYHDTIPAVLSHSALNGRRIGGYNLTNLTRLSFPLAVRPSNGWNILCPATATNRARGKEHDEATLKFNRKRVNYADRLEFMRGREEPKNYMSFWPFVQDGVVTMWTCCALRP